MLLLPGCMSVLPMGLAASRGGSNSSGTGGDTGASNAGVGKCSAYGAGELCWL